MIIPERSVKTLVAVVEETVLGKPEPHTIARLEREHDVDLSHLKHD